MAALWLQSMSLLVLLVMSWPSTQAAPPPLHLCGSHLVDALYLVCGDRGFSYNPSTASGAGVKGEMKHMLQLCCERPCDLLDLQNYCN